MSEADYSYLPELLAEIAEVAGVDAALKLARDYGGQTVYFPGRAQEGHWLTGCVGLESAQQICDHFRVRDGGARLLIPIGNRAQSHRVLSKAIRDGKSAREAANAAGVHERTVWRMRRKVRRGNGGQGSLF